MKQGWLRALVALAVVALLCACGARAEVSQSLALTGSQDETAAASATEPGLVEYLILLMFATTSADDPMGMSSMALPGDDGLDLEW